MSANGLSNGSLIIVGGGKLPEEIVKKFIELAGGPDSSIVVIPTAQGGEVDVTKKGAETLAFEEAGVQRITILHTKDRAEADTEPFAAPIRSADAVWFSGGRQWRLADAYLHTQVHRELNALLERGGVIGGSSAGATIQGSYLVRGDTKTNTILMGDHEEGFGFVQNAAIDQHLLKRNRQFDLVDVIGERPELLGIGIDESTAVVVQGESFEVIGNSYVAIYDAKYLNEHNGRFYLLSPGDTFNLSTREAKIAANNRHGQAEPAEPAEPAAVEPAAAGAASDRTE